jgi:hypothetical protein
MQKGFGDLLTDPYAIAQPGGFIYPVTPAGLTPDQVANVMYTPAPVLPSTPGYETPAAPTFTPAYIPGAYTMYPTMPGTVPYMPGMSPDPMAMWPYGMPQGVNQDIQRGKDAFNQLAAKHTIFRVPLFIAFDRSSTQALDAWYGNNANDLEALLKIALPIDVSTIAALRDWLVEVVPGRQFTPGEMVKLIQKEILHEKVSFPEVELPTRIIAFLKKIIHPNASKALELMKQKNALRTVEYDLVKNLFESQTNVKLALKEGNFVLADLDSWEKWVAQAWKTIDENPLDPHAWHVQEMMGAEAQAERDLKAQQEKIDAIDNQIAAAQNQSVTDEELFNLLLEHLDDPTIHADYDAQVERIKQANAMMQPFMDKTQAILAERSPLVSAMVKIRDTIPRMRASITQFNTGYATSTPYTQADIDQAEQFMREYNAQISAVNAKLDANYAAMAAFQKSRPDLYATKDGTSWAAIDMSSYVKNYLNKLCTEKEDQLIELLKHFMTEAAQAADEQMQAFMTEREGDIAAKQKEFDDFLQAQIEVKLKYYTDKIKEAQDNYNQIAAILQKEYDDLQALQSKITSAIDSLGGVIGWISHLNGFTPETMQQPWFIRVALQNVAAARGKYDNVIVASVPILGDQREQFWKGPGNSYDVANQTIMDMQTLDTKQLDYNSGSGEQMRKQLDSIYNYMQSLHDAYEITYKFVNSEDFVKQQIKAFNATAQQAEIQSDLTEIAKQLRDIQAQTQYNQEHLELLIDAIEESKLQGDGITVPDTIFMDFEKKKKCWHGVNEYLAKAMPQFEFLRKTLDDVVAKVNAGTADEDDANHASIIKVALLNIMGAQLVFRRLDKDTDFKYQLAADDERQAIETVNTEVAAGSA